MPVVTEAKVRKLFKANEIVEHGSFVLGSDEKLTPAARGFLADRHVTVVHSSALGNPKIAARHIPDIKKIDNIANSAALPYAVKLARLYPILLRAQRAFHRDFNEDLLQRVVSIQGMLQQIVNQRIEDDVTVYNDSFLSGAELQVIRIAKQLTPNEPLQDITLSEGQLYCYEAYVECAIIRQELEYLRNENDLYIEKLAQLLKAVEVLIWLILD